jgi:hypothetical protein
MKNPGCSEPGFFLLSLPPGGPSYQTPRFPDASAQMSFKPEAISRVLKSNRGQSFEFLRF